MEGARQEQQALAGKVAAIKAWWASPRFAHTKRPFTAEQVAAFRGTVTAEPASNYTAKKLYAKCRSDFEAGTYSHTFGCLDPVQVAQMAKYLEYVYISGWQCSSTASTSNEPGPDFADYPANTIPNKCDQLFKAQMFHDRRQAEERSRMTADELAATPKVDYMRPIIADGDTGFGGMTSVMKLMKMMIEAGAAGVHIEDQKPGAKKCGHMGGKVLVPVREHCDRLAACRLQADIMGTETVVIARTDADSATLLESEVDPRDHAYIAGCTNPSIGTLENAKDASAWVAASGLCRFTDCVAALMTKAGKAALVADWTAKSMHLSNAEARQLAASLGFDNVVWDWHAPRSREGYYQVLGGTDYSVMRAIAFSDCADLIWMETAKPGVAQVEEFARGVHAVVPHQIFAYNLSPSFNWDAAGMNDDDIAAFQGVLGKLGFAYHFITLAGFHSNALAIDNFAKAYASPTGVLNYVTMIQREERRLGVETLTHQKWSGAELRDAEMNTATGGGSSTGAIAGATEAQFAAPSKL